MGSPAKRKSVRYFLWSLALSLTLFTVMRIILQYYEPMTSLLPNVITAEKSARFYRLIANLLFSCGPLSCALLAVRRDEKVSDQFPPMQIVLLFFINELMLK